MHDDGAVLPAEGAMDVAVTKDAAEVMVPDDAAELLAPDEEAGTVVRDDATAVLVPVGAAGASAHAATTDIFASVFPPTAPAPDALATPAGAFFPAQRRGLFAWSKRVRWSVAASVVLLAAVVAGSVILAQTLAANTRAAEVARRGGRRAGVRRGTRDRAVCAHGGRDRGVRRSRGELARGGRQRRPAPCRRCRNDRRRRPRRGQRGARGSDRTARHDDPRRTACRLRRGDLDLTDIDAVTSAAQKADDRAQEITAATREARAAQAALLEKVDALKVAQVALGSSLPATADIIAGQNPRAEQSFREAVTAAARAVVDAQAAGGSGDAELLAYAAAVTALRADQVRAETNTRTVTPPSQQQPGSGTRTRARAGTGAGAAATVPPAPDPDPSPTDAVAP